MKVNWNIHAIMNEEVIEILKNISYELIASMVAWLVAVLTFRPTVKAIERWRFRKSSHLKLDDNKLFMRCFYANSNRVDEEEHVLLGYPFEYMASASVGTYLNIMSNNKADIISSPSPINKEDAIKEYRENILLLGGPNHNTVTSYFFGLKEGHTNLPFYYASYQGEDATLFYKDGDTIKTFVPKKHSSGDYYAEDYGLILNVKNPFNPEKRIIALIGCRSIGVLGAAAFFTEHNKKLRKITKNMDEYAVVIECHGDNLNVLQDPEDHFAIELKSLSENSLMKNIEK